MKEWAPEHNPYSTLVADVTHRCNMNCANCYIPNRTIPDMESERLFDFLKRLPQRVEVRIVGAEPTMRADLPEIVAGIRSLGHRPVLLSNGLRLASLPYVQELKSKGLRHCYISMNGVDRDDWYEAIDNLACAKKKMLALENLITSNFIPNIGCILVRGINESAPERIVQLLRQLNAKHCVIRLKNFGDLGRHITDETKLLSLREIMVLIEAQLGISLDRQEASKSIKGFSEGNTRFFPLVENSKIGQGIWFKLTDWAVANDDRDNLRRGRITPGWTIAPFFEHVKQNEFGY